MIKKLIFLGAPGVGKGTMAKELASVKGLIHISTGDIFRKNIKEQTKLGKQVKSILDSGDYVPDSLTNEIIKDALNRSDVKKSGFILDGYPRTINQAEFLKKENIGITETILLDAPDKLVMDRLISRAKIEKRADDTPEVISNRIDIYNKKTAPLIEWYKKENLLIVVDAKGTVEENMNNLIKELY